jgi:gamma-glutamylcyclotransferase (GGCT)/AIG2-like uncharacterized protein YtfP
MTLYFAYGSNLNRKQMARRCPAAKTLGAMKLDDWKLVFRGVADITPSPGHGVQGAVWKLTPECEAALDHYEGVSKGMYRKEYIAIAPFDFEGETHEDMLIYVMNSEGIMPPSAFYYGVIKDGYHDFSLPRASLTAALEASHEENKPSHIERNRYRRNGRPALAPRPSEKAKPPVRQQPTKQKLSAQRRAAQEADAASRKLKQPTRKAQPEPQLDLGLFRRAMCVYGD